VVSFVVGVGIRFRVVERWTLLEEGPVTKGAQDQPAKGSGRISWEGARETREFANKRDKRRKANKAARAARKRQR
jgi:hypothetical protein